MNICHTRLPHCTGSFDCWTSQLLQLYLEIITLCYNFRRFAWKCPFKGTEAKASDLVKKGKPVLRQWQLKPLCKLSVKEQTFLLKKVRYVWHCPTNHYHYQVYHVFKFVWDDVLIQLFNFLIIMIITIIIKSVSPWIFFSLLSSVVEERFLAFRKIVNMWMLIISSCFYSSFLGGNLWVKPGRDEIFCLRSKICKTCPGGHR